MISISLYALKMFYLLLPTFLSSNSMFYIFSSILCFPLPDRGEDLKEGEEAKAQREEAQGKAKKEEAFI